MLMSLGIRSSLLLLGNFDQSHFISRLHHWFDSQSQHCAAGMKSRTARPSSINKLSKPEWCVCVCVQWDCVCRACVCVQSVCVCSECVCAVRLCAQSVCAESVCAQWVCVCRACVCVQWVCVRRACVCTQSVCVCAEISSVQEHTVDDSLHAACCPLDVLFWSSSSHMLVQQTWTSSQCFWEAVICGSVSLVFVPLSKVLVGEWPQTLQP